MDSKHDDILGAMLGVDMEERRAKELFLEIKDKAWDLVRDQCAGGEWKLSDLTIHQAFEVASQFMAQAGTIWAATKSDMKKQEESDATE